MNISLNVEIIPGTDIQAAILGARKLADKLDVMITFNFNGIHFSVTPKTVLDAKHQEYERKISKLSEKENL